MYLWGAKWCTPSSPPRRPLAILFWRDYARRSACQKVAVGLLRLRGLAQRDTTYLAPDARDPRSPEARRTSETMARELRAGGFTLLDEMMEQDPDGAIAGVTRWFRNGDGTVCGWCAVLTSGHPVMMMFSEADGGRFVQTKRAPAGTERTLARPPSLDHLRLPWKAGLAEQATRHRDRMTRLASPSAWRRSETTPDAIALVRRLREANRQWRKDQPPDALLDMDLRSVLGERYDTYADGVRKALWSPETLQDAPPWVA